MSSISPSAQSSAASGVKREHQSQRRSSSRASSIGCASTATRLGKRARASASDRPMVSPSRAASASTQTSRSALLTLPTAASGARLSTPLRRRARSVASRGSHRERNRRIAKSHFLENIVLASPLQTDDALRVESLQRPLGPGARKTRLDEPRSAGEWPGQIPAGRRFKLGARRGGDLEPRLGGAGEALRLAVGAGEDQKRGRPPFARREQEAARGGEAIALEIPDLAHHRGRRAAFERLLHRPEGQSRVGGIDEYETAQGQPVGDQTRPIKGARLLSGEAL